MFGAPDEAWQFYILRLGEGDQYLCIDCFRQIAKLTDAGAMLRRYGEPIMISDPLYHDTMTRWHALTLQRQGRHAEADRMLTQLQALRCARAELATGADPAATKT
jgi:hypothetical protein